MNLRKFCKQKKVSSLGWDGHLFQGFIECTARTGSKAI